MTQESGIRNFDTGIRNFGSRLAEPKEQESPKALGQEVGGRNYLFYSLSGPNSMPSTWWRSSKTVGKKEGRREGHLSLLEPEGYREEALPEADPGGKCGHQSEGLLWTGVEGWGSESPTPTSHLLKLSAQILEVWGGHLNGPYSCLKISPTFFHGRGSQFWVGIRIS